MQKLKLFILCVASGFMVMPAHAGSGIGAPVPEIGAGGALAAVTVVGAIAAIIIERRRK